MVLAGLSWPAKSGEVGTATASFALTINGVDHGAYDLMVRHTTSTTSATYRQKNAMTRCLGGAKTLVQDRSLLRRNLALYRGGADATCFMLEFD